MSGVSIGHSHPRPCSGEKTLRRCRNNVESDDIVVIDVDSDYFDSVIIVDVPESLLRKRQGSGTLKKDKKFPYRNVIHIDDDETPANNHSGDGIQNGNFSAGPSSSMKPSADAAAGEHQFVKEHVTPVRLSKCKRTYSAKAFSRNYYGLSSDSENDSSDNDDNADCELVEDSSGEVQEQWEKAFSRRKKEIRSDHPNNGDTGISSRGIDEIHRQNLEEIRRNVQAPFSSREAKFNKNYETPSSLNVEDDIDSYPYNDPTEALKKHTQNSNLNAGDKSDYQTKESHLYHHEQDGQLGCEPGISTVNMEERWKYTEPSCSAELRQSTNEVHHKNDVYKDKETPNSDSHPSQFESSDDDDLCHGKTSEVGDDGTNPDCRSSFENEIDSGCSPSDNLNNFQLKADGSCKEGNHFESSQSHATGIRMEADKLVPEKSAFGKSVLSDNETNQECSSRGEERVREEYSGLNCQFDELEERQNDQLHNKNRDGSHAAESCLISEREKLKETDEYKRAIEEEWAARQQVLLMQAEEAQSLKRLRKKRKAESMRLIDMERRQRERIEEMRNSQKKDEENMNLKEAIRAEVMKKLAKLEVSCQNMASLLNSLGIHVGGWPSPLPQEVQTAYKRALLTFHPDRASRSGIREQVEAEEKFKLVNRLKEKFLPCA